MTATAQANPNTAQRDRWDADTGRKWLVYEPALDQILSRVTDRLLRLSDPAPDDRVLDIGCGTGATAREFAAHLTAGGRVVASDISEQMLGRARHNGGERIEFLRADAQCHDFPPGGFDLVISRFGTMFFNDPVAAFRNIRRAMRRGGRLHMACWRAHTENPWFDIPRKAAIKCLGTPAATDPHLPGPLAFADQNRVLAILLQAGFDDVTATREQVGLTHPGPVERVAELACDLGPVPKIAAELGADMGGLARTRAYVARAFGRYVTPHGVHMPASLNFFAAQA